MLTSDYRVCAGRRASAPRVAFPNDTAPRWLLRDRDAIYGDAFRGRVAGMGITEVITSPSSPWQNPYAERQIGSIRRECLNHVIVLGERHLRRLLTAYLTYYQGRHVIGEERCATFATVNDGVVPGVATRSAPTLRFPTCPIPRGCEGLPTEDSPRSSDRRVSEWPQWCSGGPDVFELSAGSSGAGAIGDASARQCLAARRSRPFATPATPWRAGPKTLDRSCGGQDA